MHQVSHRGAPASRSPRYLGLGVGGPVAAPTATAAAATATVPPVGSFQLLARQGRGERAECQCHDSYGLRVNSSASLPAPLAHDWERGAGKGRAASQVITRSSYQPSSCVSRTRDPSVRARTRSGGPVHALAPARAHLPTLSPAGATPIGASAPPVASAAAPKRTTTATTATIVVVVIIIVIVSQRGSTVGGPDGAANQRPAQPLHYASPGQTAVHGLRRLGRR